MIESLLALSLLSPAFPILDLGNCDNYGNVIQVGVANHYSCKGGDCINKGVIIQIGPGNTYECQGACWNEGVTVNFGGTNCGDPSPNVCVGSLCMITAASLQAAGPDIPSCSTRPPYPNPKIEVGCGTPNEGCGVNADPVCWSFRLACHDLRGPMEGLSDGFVTCEGQPGDGQQASDGSYEDADW